MANTWKLISIMTILALMAMAAPSLASPVMAASNGWEWQNPLPQGNALYGVWGSSGNDVFALGHSGTIRHYDGTGWTDMTSGTTNSFKGIWAVPGTTSSL